MSAVTKALLLAVAVLLSTSGHAGLFELRGQVQADFVSSECQQWPEPIFCFGTIQAVGDRSAFRLFVDIGTRLAASWEPPVAHIIESDHVFANWQLSGTDGEYSGQLFSGTNYELIHNETSYVSMDFSMGENHGMSIYAYDHDALAGEAWIQLGDSTGIAFAGLDLGTNAAVDHWLVNTFDFALFDSGSWWVETYDGGGGAAGRFLVPVPASVTLLGFGLLLFGLLGRPGWRSRGRRAATACSR